MQCGQRTITYSMYLGGKQRPTQELQRTGCTTEPTFMIPRQIPGPRGWTCH